MSQVSFGAATLSAHGPTSTLPTIPPTPQAHRKGVADIAAPCADHASSGAINVYMPRLAMAASKDTSKMASTCPSASKASLRRREIAGAAGSAGSCHSKPASASPPKRVTSHRAAVQPSCCASSKLNGTPSTVPPAMPPMITPMALPRCCCADTPAAAAIPSAR
ncbi:hypothetical protein D3C85_892070 [compost metagenome]